MKRILLFVFAAILSVNMLAQGGDLENQFYFRFGLSMPTWKYYGYDGKDQVKDYFGDDVKRSGFIFDLGSIFMLNSIPLADGMRFGINVDYLSTGWNTFKTSPGDYTYRMFNYYFGSKLGPSFSYSPVNNLTFDIYGKINPVWFTLITNLSDEPDYTTDVYLGIVDLKYSVGFNIRYAIMMLGFEYNLGSATLQNVDTDEYFRNVDYDGNKTPMPAFNVTIGLSF